MSRYDDQHNGLYPTKPPRLGGHARPAKRGSPTKRVLRAARTLRHAEHQAHGLLRLLKLFFPQ